MVRINAQSRVSPSPDTQVKPNASGQVGAGDIAEAEPPDGAEFLDDGATFEGMVSTEAQLSALKANLKQIEMFYANQGAVMNSGHQTSMSIINNIK